MDNKVVPRWLLAVTLAALGPAAGAAQYLVIGSGAPDDATPSEAVEAVEQELLPTFDALMKLEAARKIVGGMPVGDRTFAFILDAASNDEADRLLRDLPAWGQLKWEIKPLQSFQARAEKERSIADALMKKVTDPATEPAAAPAQPAAPAAAPPVPPAPAAAQPSGTPAQLTPVAPPPPAAPAQVQAAIAL
ncbi:hypothetical protein [Pseudogulbenkiania subflava]|uniref:Uncharacterized protein n=1 Tax=Pseudogulbenkiania subflava DSM 22618 TaxID=1123014 RepID=A0A1Y6BTY6_9NEIS|nr:hypothetical protein [Pseudogulbenkiania subflava]SMF28770.1 hypothetical protein SAMN02745746_02365 [Pseudogulbenkiania subflava DSM 22618]